MNWKQAATVAVAVVAVADAVLIVGAIVLEFPWEREPGGLGLLTLLQWVVTVAAVIAVIGWVLRDRA